MRREHAPCAGPTRRAWLQLGGLSLGALAAGVQPSLAGLLAAERRSKAVSKDFSVILFWANGGPSHLDLFDLKPDAPDEIRGPFKPIKTNVPGLEITECLPRLAKMAHRFSLVRSLHHKRGEHSGGTHRFLTGYNSLAANLQHSEYPDIGSVVAKQLAGQPRQVPVYAADSKAYGSGPAYLGPAFAPFMPKPNPLTSTGANSYDPVPLFLEDDANSDLILTRDGAMHLRRRDALRRTLDLPRRLDRSGEWSAFDEFQRRAVEILSGQKTREAFDLTREPVRLRERYGQTHWGKSLLTARRLVEAGVRFVQVHATYRLRKETGRTTTWDDHSVNADIFEAYREKLPSFDESVTALIEDLYARGLDERVLFVFCGEFGRTPRIARQDVSRRPGRDHWPRAMSVFVSGGGLKMGQVIGSTNARAEEPRERAMDSNALLATIYQRFGIDIGQEYHDRSGRPIAILPQTEAIKELV